MWILHKYRPQLLQLDLQLPAALLPLVQFRGQTLDQLLVVVVLPVDLPDPALDVLQVLPQLVEGVVHGLAALVDEVDPPVQVADHVLQVFQLLDAFLVLRDQPFRT